MQTSAVYRQQPSATKPRSRDRVKVSLRSLVIQYDHVLFIVVLLLVGIGTVMVYSSSIAISGTGDKSKSHFLIHHVMHLGIGIVIFPIAFLLPIDKLRSIALVSLVVALFLLVIPLVAGSTTKGAARWIRLFGFSFQPSELAKLALIVFLADRLSRQQELLRSFAQGLLPHLLIITLVLGLIVLEPDLSTSVAIALIAGIMMVTARVRVRHLLVLAAILAVLIALLIAAEPYRMSRLTGYFVGNSGTGPSYQIQQGFVAMGSGGFFGRGLGQSLQKYFFLPEPYTDSIFPIIGEELGFIGAVATLALFGFFGWRSMSIIRSQPTLFRFLLGVGLTANIMVYATLNMAVMTGLLPATGLPLPFISYGGTALLFNLVAAGLLLNLSRNSVSTSSSQESEKTA